MEDHTTIAVDLSKSVFEIAVSQSPGRVCERRRLSRGRELLRQASSGDRSSGSLRLGPPLGTPDRAAGPPGPPAASSSDPPVCSPGQDRRRRCQCVAGGASQRADLPGPRQDSPPAGPGRPSPDPFRVDGRPCRPLERDPGHLAGARPVHPGGSQARPAQARSLPRGLSAAHSRPVSLDPAGSGRRDPRPGLQHPRRGETTRRHRRQLA
jgi:hypothetical protein